MYISFLFFCHLCLLYFTVRVEQSSIHARGCCFCHPSTFQNPGPQSAKWTHPKKFLYSVNLQWKFTLAFQQSQCSQWIQWISESNFNSAGPFFLFLCLLDYQDRPRPVQDQFELRVCLWRKQILMHFYSSHFLLLLFFAESSWGLPVFVWTFDHILSNLIQFASSQNTSSNDFSASLDIIDQATTASLPLLPKSAFTGTKTPPDSPPTWHSMAQLWRSSTETTQRA